MKEMLKEEIFSKKNVMGKIHVAQLKINVEKMKEIVIMMQTAILV